MNDQAKAGPPLIERFKATLTERLALVIVLGVFGSLALVGRLAWEVISDGRIIDKLGGVKQNDHDALAQRITDIEAQVGAQNINNTVVEWLDDPDPDPERRLAIFEDDVDVIAGRVQSAPQLCPGISRLVRFCIGGIECPSNTYTTIERSDTYSKLVVDQPDWLIGAGWTYVGGGAFDAQGNRLRSSGILSVKLNAGGRGFLEATYLKPDGAHTANVQFKLTFLYVDQDFDGAGTPCKLSENDSNRADLHALKARNRSPSDY